MRYVLLLVGAILLGLGSSYCWNWYAGGLAYPESINGTQRQLCVMIGAMMLVGCGLISAGIGSWRQAGLEGLFLGLIGGPLGVIAAFLPDNRPKCLQCSGRLEAAARVCPHCQAAFAPRKSATKADADAWENRKTEADQRHSDWLAGGKRRGADP